MVVQATSPIRIFHLICLWKWFRYSLASAPDLLD
jgi:hypothetical protein